MAVEVTDNPGQHRYEAHVDGELAGFAAYTLSATQIVFTHTEVHLEGRGVGSALVRAALDDVRRRGGLQVVPRCPFVRAFIDKHPAYADLT
ncbi:GNAT family N-acetyltransferase [Nocardioides sp.]|uniref:GNAT family N-acetyltransferase n=1 Tax=Nocardioides sp. TaxID=35761 RepID=UPI003D1137D5